MKKLQILGGGCPNCKKLAAQTEEAAQQLGIEYELIKVTKIEDIMSFGIATTPCLVVDGVVKVCGKIPPIEDIKKMIQEEKSNG